jgi:hypothetical protein
MSILTPDVRGNPTPDFALPRTSDKRPPLTVTKLPRSKEPGKPGNIEARLSLARAGELRACSKMVSLAPSRVRVNLPEEAANMARPVESATKRPRISIDVQPHIRRRLRLAAAKHDLTIRRYVLGAIEERLREDLGGRSAGDPWNARHAKVIF